jgi:MSHA biogenesis protein MshL
MGFFYSVRKNTLFIQQDGQFIVELPPALSDDNMAGLTNTLQYLGAKDPYIDRMNRSLVFRTNRKSLAKIEAYLDKIRETRSLIIYDINIFQVDLTDNADTGIAWNALNYASSPSGSINTGGSTGGTTPSASGSGVASAVGAMIGSAAQATATGLGLGLVLSSSKFSVDMLINFLKTQGSLKALSRPRLAVISGTKGSIRVGQATTYVSKVGSSATNLVNQVTTETKDLRTGVDLGLFGDYSDNTVYTRIGLSISEIIRLNKFTALGTDLTLPQTADREINTVVRARPGDMILLGGITIERDSMDVSKGATVNTSAKQVERSELVLALKTKIVNFRPKKPKTVAAAPVIPVEPPKPAPVAIVPSAPVVQAPPPPAPAPIAAAIVVVKKPEPELGLPAYAVLAPTAAGAVITDPVLNVPREFRTGGRLPSGEVIVSINGQNGEVTTDKRVIRMAE